MPTTAGSTSSSPGRTPEAAVEWTIVAVFAIIAAVAIGLAREPHDEVAPDLELLLEQRRIAAR